MNIFHDLAQWGRDAWRFIASAPSSAANAARASWRFITSVSQLIDWVIAHPFTGLVLGVQSLAAILTLNTRAIRSVNDRINAYVYGTQTAPLDTRLSRQIRALAAWTARRLYVLWAHLEAQLGQLRRWTARQLAAERQYRIRGDRAAEAYAHRQAALVHQTIEREATAAYHSGRKTRAGILGRVLGTIGGRVPLVAAVTRRLVVLVLDAAAVDNPVARITAGWLLRWLVGRLGIDRAIGDLAGRLGAGLLGDGAPASLGGVITDLDGRVSALESGQAAFMADGGPQVLQAGEGWRDLTGLVTDAALLGFAASAVLDPEQTAIALAGVIRPVGTATISAAAALLAGR